MTDTFENLPLVDALIKYEEGEMEVDEQIRFLNWLHDTGTLQGLQGAYQRAYMRLCRP